MSRSHACVCMGCPCTRRRVGACFSTPNETSAAMSSLFLHQTTFGITTMRPNADRPKLSLPLHQFALGRPFLRRLLLATFHFLLCIRLTLLQQFVAQRYPGFFYQHKREE